MEMYSGFIAWAVRPRFLLTTKNVLDHGEQVLPPSLIPLIHFLRNPSFLFFLGFSV